MGLPTDGAATAAFPRWLACWLGWMVTGSIGIGRQGTGVQGIGTENKYRHTEAEADKEMKI